MVRGNTGHLQTADVDPLEIYGELPVFLETDEGETVSGQSGGHGIGDVLVGLKAAFVDAGADGGQKIGGIGAVDLRFVVVGEAVAVGVDGRLIADRVEVDNEVGQRCILGG